MKAREGELRKVNVVYFISRDGKVEQPHLIRVQQLHSHGVHLRDVKRWLAALRGDNMPDSFAWSFKRRYKNGYVWQDLRDDDLITPFSDTEYTLKGSELLLRSVEEDRQQRSTTTLDMSLSSAKTKNSLPISTPQESLPLSSSSSSSPPPPQSQDTSDESSTHSAVVFKKQKEDGLNNISNRNSSSSSSSRINNNNNNNNKEHTSTSKNNDSRKKASRLLHNLIHCRTIDTSDSILRPVIGRQVSMEVTSQSRRSLGGGTTRSHDQQHRENSGHRYPNARKRSSDSEGRRSWRKGTGEKTVRVVNRSAGPEPNCSQCGNNFKPDKLHAHMKSCKVLKAKRRKEKEQGHY